MDPLSILCVGVCCVLASALFCLFLLVMAEQRPIAAKRSVKRRVEPSYARLFTMPVRCLTLDCNYVVLSV